MRFPFLLNVLTLPLLPQPRGLATTMANNDSTKNLNLRNFDAYLVYSKRGLVRYTKFPKLYGEMKYARPLVSCSSPIVLLKTNTVQVPI
jgi:hypothetical protein